MKKVKNEIMILFLVSLTVILILFGLKDRNRYERKSEPTYYDIPEISYLGTYDVVIKDTIGRLTLRKDGTFLYTNEYSLVGTYVIDNSYLTLKGMTRYEKDGCFTIEKTEEMTLKLLSNNIITYKDENESLIFTKDTKYTESNESINWFVITPIDNTSPSGLNKKWIDCNNKQTQESNEDTIKETKEEPKKQETKEDKTKEESAIPSSKETILINYGDVNKDKKVNVIDANLVNKFLKEDYKLDEQALKNADINDDGIVNNTDYILIKAVSANIYNHSLNTPLKNYTIYGDVNSNSAINVIDANIINKYLNDGQNLDKQGLKNADVNADGKIDNTDYILLRAISAKVYAHTGDTPLKTYTIYGDVNSDGVINIVDSNMVNRYINNEQHLEGQPLRNSDINGDNKVDITDYLLIRAVSAKIYNQLGDTPIKNYIIYGDVNSDGRINVIDANLVNRYLNAGLQLDNQSKKNADINGDGKVDETDYKLIKDVAAKKYDHNGITPLKAN